MFRGNPEETQVTGSARGVCGQTMRTVSVADAVPPRPSETVTRTVMLVGQETPAVSSVVEAPVPLARPALADQV
jgi:hypothetical protein